MKVYTRHQVRRLTTFVAIAFALLGVVVGALGALGADLMDKPCRKDQVFVVNTERCVSATNHGAHVEDGD